MTSKIYAIIFRFPTSGISSPTASSASCQHESHLQSEVGGSDDYEFTDGDGDGDVDGGDHGSSNSDGDDGDGSSDGDGFSDSDGFGDCGQSDGFERFDGVENLLLDENPISNDMFAPLYPGAAITICAAYCAIMTYATTNKLSYSAIENLLKLLHLLCPSSH